MTARRPINGPDLYALRDGHDILAEEVNRLAARVRDLEQQIAAQADLEARLVTLETRFRPPDVPEHLRRYVRERVSGGAHQVKVDGAAMIADIVDGTYEAPGWDGKSR